jgi:hypothetical protein
MLSDAAQQGINIKTICNHRLNICVVIFINVICMYSDHLANTGISEGDHDTFSQTELIQLQWEKWGT